MRASELARAEVVKVLACLATNRENMVEVELKVVKDLKLTCANREVAESFRFVHFKFCSIFSTKLLSYPKTQIVGRGHRNQCSTRVRYVSLWIRFRKSTFSQVR